MLLSRTCAKQAYRVWQRILLPFRPTKVPETRSRQRDWWLTGQHKWSARVYLRYGSNENWLRRRKETERTLNLGLVQRIESKAGIVSFHNKSRFHWRNHSSNRWGDKGRAYQPGRVHQRLLWRELTRWATQKQSRPRLQPVAPGRLPQISSQSTDAQKHKHPKWRTAIFICDYSQSDDEKSRELETCWRRWPIQIRWGNWPVTSVSCRIWQGA